MAFNLWQFGMNSEPGDRRSETEKYVETLLSEMASRALHKAAGNPPTAPPVIKTEEPLDADSGLFHRETTNCTMPWTHSPQRVLRPWEHQICDGVKQARRELELSQLQLARVLNTSIRSVKRWEAHQCKPVARQRQFLDLLVKYADENGLPAFIERYVREEPRYQKSGPASSLAENSFDSRVRRESPSAFVIGLTAEDPFKD